MTQVLAKAKLNCEVERTLLRLVSREDWLGDLLSNPSFRRSYTANP